MLNADDLRKSKDKAQVAYSEFMLSTERFSDSLFCFFEGKDNPYYVSRIKQFTMKYHPIKCGGRENVLKVHKLINNKREYDKYKKGFFIDRDFNEPLKPKSLLIFETPCYSIENFYVSITVFKEILTNEFSISEASDNALFNLCLNLFSERQREFHRAVCLFNAWYACLIDEKVKYGKETGVSLEDKFPRGFLEFSLDGVIQKYDFERIKDKFLNATEISTDQLNEKYSEFLICEQHKVFRGKYEMEFLLKFINMLLIDAKSSQKYLQKKINFTFGDGSMNNEQAIAVFGIYAETPESLIEYLKVVS